MGPSRAAALLLLLFLVPACGRMNPPAGSAPPPGGNPPPPTVEVSWADDVWPILLVRCQLCHTTGAGSEQVPDMRMTDPSTLYDRWVRVFSRCNPNLFRVLPGESGLSFVYDKISRVAPLCGERMPPDGPPLEPAEQQTIKDWIDQGARRN
jgi:hypothetical protein